MAAVRLRSLESLGEIDGRCPANLSATNLDETRRLVQAQRRGEGGTDVQPQPLVAQLIRTVLQ